MAEVFLARQDGPQGFAKTVVIKKILPHYGQDQAFVQMFLNEARLAALINHPNVVSIYELGEDAMAETYYMAMEYIDGCNLKRLAQGAYEQHRPISPSIAARLVADAAAGLDFAHSLKGEGQKPLNIVHRDVSPENILITYSGLVKVVDFGIAKAAYSETKTRTGQIKGKISYMSPEQVLAKEIDRRTDVWALGVTLYWLLTSTKPFRGENEAQVIHQILSIEPPALPPNIPAELQRILGKALAKNPDERYASAASLQADLERWLSSAGQNVNASTVALYMSELFPESTDPDRLLTRAILSGELRQMLGQQNTPSRSLAGENRKTSLSRTITADRPEPRRQSRRMALLAGLLLLFLVGGVGAFIWHQDHAESGDQAGSVATGPDAVEPNPTLPVIQPVVAPTGPVTPPVPHPVTPIVVAPTGTPTLPVKPVVSPTGPSHPGRAHVRPPHVRPVVPVPNPNPRDVEHNEEPPPEPPEPRGPPGRLVIRVLPWASVFIDGRMVGTTPFEPIDVPAGRHRVELINDELHVKRVINVDVKSGETSTVQEKLE